MSADPALERIRKAVAKAAKKIAQVSVSRTGDAVMVLAELDEKADAAAADKLKAALEKAARKAADGPVRVALTQRREASQTSTAPAAPPARPRRAARSGVSGDGVRPDFDHVDVIAVGGGKGGVGKSTVAANLAVACAKLGRKAGLLDADIYGPSAPTLFGLSDAPKVDAGKRPIAPHAHGVAVMSIGLLVRPEKALAWRGPMATGALNQLWRDTVWGDIDLLVIDMPPGTGDIQLTIAQRLSVAGAVIVTTPNEIALADARRAVALFRSVRTPILGLVENMSVVLDPATGARVDLFGEGGGRAEAERLDAHFLGAIPMTPDLRASVDGGAPVAAQDDRPEARVFQDLAAATLERLSHEKGAAKPAPRIIFE